MIELLPLYLGAIVSGLLCATALALLGCHLVSRNQSLQCLVISQAATVGVLAGAALNFGSAAVSANELPLITGLLFASLTALVSDRLASGRAATESGIHLALFSLLLAMSYWLVSFFPALESHFSQAFFGDIVTISGNTLWVSSGVSALVLTVLLIGWKRFSDQSFTISIMSGTPPDNRFALLVFRTLSLLLIVTSIYAMGFLFTIAFLLLPTVMLSSTRVPSIKRHFVLICVAAISGFSAGFLLSLHFDRISTVPTIVLTTGLLSALYLALAWLRPSLRPS
jgi:ABC-type Mn2+/Zn2+ transport system permease subunit